MEQVLIVDDDTELAELVTAYLRREGFEVESVHDGEAGVQRALSSGPDLIVLDVMLPGIGGFEVLRRIRSSTSAVARVPILMLTARGDEIDRVMGLEWGADDYLAKPHSPRELLARIRATLRRVQLERNSTSNSSPEAVAPDLAIASSAKPPTPATERLRVGDVEWDSAARSVRVGGELVELTAAEFDLLGLLLRRAGEVVTRETISREVFHRPLMAFDRSLDVHISNLRRKLAVPTSTTSAAPSIEAASERLKTVRGSGYIYAKV